LFIVKRIIYAGQQKRAGTGGTSPHDLGYCRPFVWEVEKVSIENIFY
jgi:hypothetical protein